MTKLPPDSSVNEKSIQTEPGVIGSSQPMSEMRTSTQAVSAVVTGEEDHLNADGRARWEWKSKYDSDAICGIRIDAIYVGVVFLLTLATLVLTWKGVIYTLVAADCLTCERAVFDKYVYFFLGGALGGTLFGIKFLYKVVAHGYWHLDRRLWRIFSPFLSGGLALAVGALIDSGIFGLTVKAPTNPSYFSIGFIAGYFADSAIGKMQEIALTIFGSAEKHKTSEKSEHKT